VHAATRHNSTGYPPETRTFEVERIVVPHLPLPSRIDLTKVDIRAIVPNALRNLPLPEVDADRVVAVAKDAGYTAVGAAVLAFQRAQVRRREFESWVARHVPQASDAVVRAGDAAEQVVATVAKAIRKEPPQN
jgi:hypothetical protein